MICHKKMKRLFPDTIAFGKPHPTEKHQEEKQYKVTKEYNRIPLYQILCIGIYRNL